jgi:hypothetical protein
MMITVVKYIQPTVTDIVLNFTPARN